MSGYETGVGQSGGDDAPRLPAKSLFVFYLHGTGYLIITWAFFYIPRPHHFIWWVPPSAMLQIQSTMSFSCCKIEQKKENYRKTLYLKFTVRNLKVSLPQYLSYFSISTSIS
jgi:hypothetical protein